MAENIVEDAVGRNNLLNRLSALQNLCSDDDLNYPKALLLVAGQDGKGNKGSISIIKYLLLGSVAKDLYDETLDAQYEPLEEIVMLIKHSSVSVLWSHEMKRLLSPAFSHIPMLVEYLSTTEEESEIDLYQARKCTDFKRMILSNLEVGDGVGVPVPLGYSDVTDIESWPLLQAFAVDTVYCPTGFFTSRYTVMDLTAPLFSGLYQCVDGCYVDNALETTQKTIVPHVLQTLALLGCSGAGSTADKRSRVTAEEAAGPLDLLFDFGEFHAVNSIDPVSRPAVLFGEDSALLGATFTGSDSEAWHNTKAGSSLHCLVEGCEPSTGMRFCRTYFLQRGKSLPVLSVLDALVDDEGKDGDSKEESKGDWAAMDAVPTAVTTALHRLESLYVKLWLSLRYCVKYAFLTNTDVLEAGQDIQRYMDLIMNGILDDLGEDEDAEDISQEYRRGYAEITHSFAAVDLAAVHLLPTEQLQVHMDCMTALGQLAAIEDVDDMGGGCWSYIRVSVHGVSLPKGGSGTVAVGDTFLFSPLSTKGHSSTSPNTRISGTSAQTVDGNFPQNPHTALPLISDTVCVTHGIPYYRCLMGQGAEEASAQRLLSCCKSTHYLKHLGLGSQLDYSGTGLLSLPLLTDHPVVPLVDAEVRLYSEGLLIERMDSVAGLPVLISIEAHVKCMWVVDSNEVSTQASRLLPPMLSTFPALLPEHCPEGKLIVLQLKSDADLLEEREREGEDLKAVLQHNLLARALPFTGNKSEPQLAAIFVPARARASQAMSTALASWKISARRHDVPVHRGADKPLPAGILTAFLTALDRWAMSGLSGGGTGSDSLQVASGGDAGRITGTASIGGECSSGTLVTTAQYCVQNPCVQIPVISQLSLRYVHSLAEAQRLALNNSSPERLRTVAGLTPLHRTTTRSVCVVVGMGGSGNTAVAAQLVSQLPGKLQDSSAISLIHIDLADMYERYPSSSSGSTMDAAYIDTYLNDAISDALPNAPLSPLMVLNVSLSAMGSPSSVAALLQLIADKMSATIEAAVSVVSTACLQLDGLQSTLQSNYCSEPYLSSKYGMGQEQWQAVCLQLLRPSLCDVCVAVDHFTAPSSSSSSSTSSSSSSTNYSLLRAYLALVNPAAALLRLTASARLRLDGEAIELIASKLTPSPASSMPTSYTSSQHVATIAVSLSARTARLISEGYEMVASNDGSSLYPPLKVLRTGVAPVSGGEPAGGVKRVQVFRISPSLLNMTKLGWNLGLVLQTLQLLLPQASLYNQSLCDDCWVPPLMTKASESRRDESANGLPKTTSRLVQLASAKVMAARQTSEGTSLYTQRLQALLDGTKAREADMAKARGKDSGKSKRERARDEADAQENQESAKRALPQALKSLIASIRSVNGTVERGSEGVRTGFVLGPASSSSSSSAVSSAAQVVSIEACRGFISLKRGASSTTSESLLIEGVFDDQDRDLLHALFALCAQHYLSPKAPLTLSEITPSLQADLQQKELAAVARRRQRTGEGNPVDENSGGWWFDGNAFVDVHGARSDVQPTTIGRLVDQHLAEQNRQRAVYNSMLRYCQ